MTGRRVSKSAHRMEGEVYVGRPLPAVAVFDATLKKARKRDSAAIETFKEGLKSNGAAKKND